MATPRGHCRPDHPEVPSTGVCVLGAPVRRSRICIGGTWYQHRSVRTGGTWHLYRRVCVLGGRSTGTDTRLFILANVYTLRCGSSQHLRPLAQDGLLVPGNAHLFTSSWCVSSPSTHPLTSREQKPHNSSFFGSGLSSVFLHRALRHRLPRPLLVPKG